MANTRKKRDITGMTMAERYPMTISQQLFDAWQILRRYGDPGRIHDLTKISRPIIDRALNFGNVKQPHVERKITEYFNDRFNKEKNNGDKLIKIAKK